MDNGQQVSGLGWLVAPQALGQKVTVVVNRPAEVQPPVRLDPGKIREALLNLVVNALEAMPDGGTLTLESRSEETSLVLSVADTGVGMEDDVRENLFRPYVTTKPGGTGIGLALVEKLVSQHGGHVGFVTGPTGTTFRLTLPGDGVGPAELPGGEGGLAP